MDTEMRIEDVILDVLNIRNVMQDTPALNVKLSIGFDYEGQFINIGNYTPYLFQS